MSFSVYVKSFTELSLQELYEILALRNSVFVVEQACAYQDIDGRDETAVHVIVREEEKLLAYLRVLPRGNGEAAIGRVLAVERRKGLATLALQAGITAAKERFGAKRIYLEAQTYARDLYEKQGFLQCGEEFLEDGIPHIPMELYVI
ncbi:MAG: GNAT family N-acetyltransferase [Oscillibacter sp.]|nr:GNAT family N-acetyltransferase [Oscillibacter sp.]